VAVEQHLEGVPGRKPGEVLPAGDLPGRKGEHPVDRVVGLVPALRLCLLGPPGDLGELLPRAGEIGVEQVRDPVLDRERPPAAFAFGRGLSALEPRAAERAANERGRLVGQRLGHPPFPRAASTSARVTSTMASRSATAMLSSGVWMSVMPFARFTHWRPRSLKTFASAAPPERL